MLLHVVGNWYNKWIYYKMYRKPICPTSMLITTKIMEFNHSLIKSYGVNKLKLGFVSFLVIWFLAHLSWKLKWAFLIVCRSSSVRLSLNFSHFHLLLKNHWANFKLTWHKASLCDEKLIFNKWGPFISQKGDKLNKFNNTW